MWASVILLFAVLPCEKIPALTIGCLDKILHFSEYFFLAVLMVWAFYYDRKDLSFGRVFLIILILGGGYGIVMELLQYFVAGRYPSPGDGAANLSGVLSGAMVGKVVIWRK